MNGTDPQFPGQVADYNTLHCSPCPQQLMAMLMAMCDRSIVSFNAGTMPDKSTVSYSVVSNCGWTMSARSGGATIVGKLVVQTGAGLLQYSCDGP